METSTLRWILIITGLVLLAGLFLFGNPNKKSRRRATRSRRKARKSARRKARERTSKRQEPKLAPSSPSGDTDGADPAEKAGEQGELEISASSGVEEARQAPPGPPPEKVVVLYLQARDNRRIAGAELLEVALKSGMEFGTMDIFHRQHPGAEQPIFSLANLTKPGHFDRTAWNTMEIKGVTLFMALPGPVGALDAWDAMLATGRRLAELLHLDLLDDRKEVFTRQREGEIREELRAWERTQLPEG